MNSHRIVKIKQRTLKIQNTKKIIVIGYALLQVKDILFQGNVYIE